MSNFLLGQLLYNQKIKDLANFLLTQKWFLGNPVYVFLLKKRIGQVVASFSKTPFALRVENTNYCNARCFMCPHQSMKRKKGIMSRKLYQKIIDEAAVLGIGYLNLHNFGEPLLDKDFFWRVKYAKEKGISRVTTSTNGQLLSGEVALKIIDSGLDEIFVSLDAASKRTYQKIRIGLNYEKVMKNVKVLAMTRKKLGAQKPVITVDFLVSEINQGEKKKFIKRWEAVADNICLSALHDWTSKKEGIVFSKFASYTAFSQTPCRLPFTELLVNWDGRVSLCCQDVEGEEIVGDVNKNSLVEVWTGEKLKKIRQKHMNLATNQLKLCRYCKLRTFWWTF